MNKAVVVLTTGTIVLTGTTLYFAHQLGELRSRAPPLARTVVVGTPEPTADRTAAEVSTAAAGASAPAAPASNAVPPAAIAATPVDGFAKLRAGQADSARKFLSQYEDAETRKRMFAGAIESKRKRLRKAANALDIPDEDLETLIELQIDARMDRQVRIARCVLDPDCTQPAPPPASLEERGQAITEKIGEQKLAQLRAHDRRNGPEAPMVARFQSRLPPKLRLAPAEEDALLDALGQEVQQMLRELRAGDREVSTFSGYSVVPYVKGIPTMEENMEMAYRASRRLEDIAATQLSGKRLETFQTLQADGVVKFREFIRRQIQLRAAGYEGS